MTMLGTTGGIPVHTSVHVVGNGLTFLFSWKVTGSLFISVADSSETQEEYVPAEEEAVLGLGPQSQARSPRPAVPDPQSQRFSWHFLGTQVYFSLDA